MLYFQKFLGGRWEHEWDWVSTNHVRHWNGTWNRALPMAKRRSEHSTMIVGDSIYHFGGRAEHGNRLSIRNESFRLRNQFNFIKTFYRIS